MCLVSHSVESMKHIGAISCCADLREEDEITVFPWSVKPPFVFQLARPVRLKACCSVSCKLDAPASAVVLGNQSAQPFNVRAPFAGTQEIARKIHIRLLQRE